MKAFIIGGAGTIGSASAFLLAKEGLCNEIVLYDTYMPMAMNHAMDMLQAVSGISGAVIRTGTLEDMADSDLVVSAFGYPREDADKFGKRDVEMVLPIIEEVCSTLKKYAPKAVVITMTNPLDPINYMMYRLSGLSRRQFLGFSINDTLRMRWGISQYTGVPAKLIECASMGEHGASKVQIYSQAKVNGEPLRLDDKEAGIIDNIQLSFWNNYVSCNVNRTAGWTSAIGMVEIAECLTGRRSGFTICSCVLNGEYGLSGISVGVPVFLDKNGVREIIVFDLATDENHAFFASADKVRAMTNMF